MSDNPEKAVKVKVDHTKVDVTISAKDIKNGLLFRKVGTIRTWLQKQFRIKSGFIQMNSRETELLFYSLVNFDQVERVYRKNNEVSSKAQKREILFSKLTHEVLSMSQRLDEISKEIGGLIPKERKTQKSLKLIDESELPEI